MMAGQMAVEVQRQNRGWNRMALVSGHTKTLGMGVDKVGPRKWAEELVVE